MGILPAVLTHTRRVTLHIAGIGLMFFHRGQEKGRNLVCPVNSRVSALAGELGTPGITGPRY